MIVRVYTMKPVRLEVRISEDELEVVEGYCKRTGATKSGTIRMLIPVLRDEKLLQIVQKLTQD